jgi:putative methionine-R-sulfoxide reductase with GAF domain
LGAADIFSWWWKEIVSEEKDKPAGKPAFDERPLARLLEAAFVLQEHNRELQQVELSLDRQREEREQREHDSAVSVPESTITAPQRPDPTQTIPNEAMPAAATPAGKNDFSTLAQIVEVQHQIQSRHLELEKAMALVAERMVEIGKAGGAAVGSYDGKKVRYRAAVGSMTLPVGAEVSTEKALSSACLRAGEIICCSDVNPEFLLDATECRSRGIAALIAVPIYHDGRVAGVLELYYASTQAFTDQDSHTCQLMAGLITEALARDEEVTWKQSLASERAVMMDALEKLKPNLAAMVDSPTVREPTKPTAPAATTSSSQATTPTVFLCRKCGHQFLPGEQFCGSCGAPRSTDYEPPSMQSKVASLWQMQEAMRKSAPSPAEPATSANRNGEKSVTESIEEAMPEFFSSTHRTSDPEPTRTPDRKPNPMTDDEAEESTRLLESIVKQHGGEFTHENAKSEIMIPFPRAREDGVQDDLDEVRVSEHEEGEDSAAETAPAKPTPVHWSSASSARTFLEQLKAVNQPGGMGRFWRARRGDIYLAIAVVLVAMVIRWGMWSNHSVSATGTTPSSAHGKPGPGPDPDPTSTPEVSLYDRILISLGLAEPPPAPEYKGNPGTKVWVDLHTALYYCPGADLYGKTPKGKFTSQKDAQLDQFEPAYRKACD